MICRLDTGNDGYLTLQEIEKGIDSVKEGSIVINQLADENIRRQMDQFDIDKDGKLEAYEILAALKESHARHKFLKYAVISLVIALLVSYVTLGWLVHFVIQLAKDSSIAPNGAMMIKGTDQIVQVGSADFTVKDGVFHTQPQKKCSAESCPAPEPIKTSQARPPRADLRTSLIPFQRIGNLDIWVITCDTA